MLITAYFYYLHFIEQNWLIINKEWENKCTFWSWFYFVLLVSGACLSWLSFSNYCCFTRVIMSRNSLSINVAMAWRLIWIYLIDGFFQSHIASYRMLMRTAYEWLWLCTVKQAKINLIIRTTAAEKFNTSLCLWKLTRVVFIWPWKNRQTNSL